MKTQQFLSVFPDTVNSQSMTINFLKHLTTKVMVSTSLLTVSRISVEERILLSLTLFLLILILLKLAMILQDKIDRNTKR